MVNRLVNRLRGSQGIVPESRTVLVVEDRPFVADSIAEQLYEQDNVRVVWCRDADGDVLCAGRVADRCPLTSQVDFVLDVRTGEAPRLTGEELGVACAGTGGIPVIVVEPARPGSERNTWGLATCAPDEAVDFCRHVLNHPTQWQEQRIADIATRVLRVSGDDVGEVDVEFRRWDGALTVVVRTERDASPTTCASINRTIRSARPSVVLEGDVLRLSFARRSSGDQSHDQ